MDLSNNLGSSRRCGTGRKFNSSRNLLFHDDNLVNDVALGVSARGDGGGISVLFWGEELPRGWSWGCGVFDGGRRRGGWWSWRWRRRGRRRRGWWWCWCWAGGCFVVWSVDLGDLDFGDLDFGNLGVGRASKNLNGSWKAAFDERAVFIFEFGGHLELAFVLVRLGLKIEQGAIFDTAGEICAGFHSFAEEAGLPGFNEIGMVATSLRVAVGENEFTLDALEFGGVPDGLEKERYDAGLKALGADTVFDQIGVGHVGFVVWTVEILAVPAGWEHHLHAEAIRAIGVDFTFFRQSVTEEGRLWRRVVVQAVKPNGFLGEGKLRCFRTTPG